jgi:hypothetical protein|tara:strand:- start:4789 stop:4920 length:132 start_codon:yes stop_codon:yes gene_type:complete
MPPYKDKKFLSLLKEKKFEFLPPCKGMPGKAEKILTTFVDHFS